MAPKLVTPLQSELPLLHPHQAEHPVARAPTTSQQLRNSHAQGPQSDRLLGISGNFRNICNMSFCLFLNKTLEYEFQLPGSLLPRWKARYSSGVDCHCSTGSNRLPMLSSAENFTLGDSDWWELRWEFWDPSYPSSLMEAHYLCILLSLASRRKSCISKCSFLLALLFYP